MSRFPPGPLPRTCSRRCRPALTLLLIAIQIAGASLSAEPLTTFRPEPATRTHSSNQQRSRTAAGHSDWSHVARLKSGAAVTLVLRDKPRSERVVLSADDSGLVVLSLDPVADRSDRSRLGEIASRQPGVFTGAAGGELVDGQVRVSREGVFIHGQLIGQISDLVSRVDRSEVSEVHGRLPYSGRRDAVVGMVVGGGLYALIGTALCKSEGGSQPCGGDIAKVALLGAGVFAGLGVLAGATRHAMTRPTGLIYRAP